MAEASTLASTCDMAEELSRQLEDILSTYCQQDAAEDTPLPNGQLDGLEVNGLADREDGKSEEVKVNGGSGGGGGGGEKDQKKIQDKKKVKGLGEQEWLNWREKGKTVTHLFSGWGFLSDDVFRLLGCMRQLL